jgi:Protein of unknown function (DUF2587)
MLELLLAESLLAWGSMDDNDPERGGDTPAPAVAAQPAVTGDGEQGARPAVTEPDKVLRIATMVRELLDETRQAAPDEKGRVMLRAAYERAVQELSEVLSPDLQRELEALAPSMESVPTESEVRVAQALLVGWLEGLFHGIQAAMYAQQMAARAQFEELRRRSLPPGMVPPGMQQPDQQLPPGQYL